MKLPVLLTRSLPSLFKHCSNVLTLHIDIVDEGIDTDGTFAKAYLEYVRMQMYASIESNFVTSLASRVYAQEDTFLVFKSNTTKKILLDFLFALFAELDSYCEQHITISYQYLECMLLQENVAVKFYKANSVGESIKDSSAYVKANVVYEHNKKPRGKQLCSIEEYRNIYAHQPKSIFKSSIIQENTAKQAPSLSNNNTNEDTCEYYI